MPFQEEKMQVKILNSISASSIPAPWETLSIKIGDSTTTALSAVADCKYLTPRQAWADTPYTYTSILHKTAKAQNNSRTDFM